MKKNIIYLASMMLAMMVAMPLVSCSSDDSDGGSLPELPNVSDAVKFEIHGSSEYRSIELTEFGSYIIVKNGYNYAPQRSMAMAKKHETLPPFLAKPATSLLTRGDSAPLILDGKYTKNPDGTYNLEGFGTLTINGGSDGYKSLEIKKNDGTTVTLQATQTSKIASSELTSKLCRKWKFNGLRAVYKINGKTVYDIKASTYKEFIKKIYEAEGEEFDEDEYEDEKEYSEPESVIFTQSGTYMVFYEDNEYMINYWKWHDTISGCFLYSDNETPDDFNEHDPCYVEFSGSKLTVRSEEKWEEDGVNYEEVDYTYLVAD